MRPILYSAADIADIVRVADDLSPDEHDTVLNRMRYLGSRTYKDAQGVEQPLLRNGEKIDARGKRAYPALEVYRAAVFNDLMGIAIDVRGLEAVMEAAAKSHTHRFGIAGTSRGALLDAIEGVARGENWQLTLERLPAGQIGPAKIVARIAPEDAPDLAAVSGAITGARPRRTFARINLTALFAPIIAQIGVPE